MHFLFPTRNFIRIACWLLMPALIFFFHSAGAETKSTKAPTSPTKNLGLKRSSPVINPNFRVARFLNYDELMRLKPEKRRAYIMAVRNLIVKLATHKRHNQFDFVSDNRETKQLNDLYRYAEWLHLLLPVASAADADDRTEMSNALAETSKEADSTTQALSILRKKKVETRLSERFNVLKKSRA